MAKAIKVREVSFETAKCALEQAGIMHTWDTRKNAHQTYTLIVLNKDKNAAKEAIENALVKILRVSNRRHWEMLCLTNGYWQKKS